MQDICYLHGFVERRNGDNKTEKFEGFPLPVNGVVEGLALDKAGNVIFSLGHVGRLGAMNIASKEFLVLKVVLGNSEPGDIAVDGEGNIWLADLSQNALIKVYGAQLGDLWVK